MFNHALISFLNLWPTERDYELQTCFPITPSSIKMFTRHSAKFFDHDVTMVSLKPGTQEVRYISPASCFMSLTQDSANISQSEH